MAVNCESIIKSAVIISENGQLLGDTEATSPGTVVNLSCQQGYTLQGPSVLVCQTNGRWNDLIPTCGADNSVSSTRLTNNLSSDEKLVIGVVVAVVLVVLIAIVTLCCCYHFRSKRRRYKDQMRHYRRRELDDIIHTSHMDRGSIHSGHSLPGVAWYNDYSHHQPSGGRSYLARVHYPSRYATYDRYGNNMMTLEGLDIIRGRSYLPRVDYSSHGRDYLSRY